MSHASSVSRRWLPLAALWASACACAADAPSDPLYVWDFDQGITNPWGGQYNNYQREPSWARTYLDPAASFPRSGHSLRVTAHREADGFCGIWLDFHPATGASRGYLDASAFRYLSLWAKGEKGGEDFEIELVDDAHVNDEGTRSRRPLRAYLPHGLSTNWQEVTIPLADFPGLNRRQLAQMTLNLVTPGDFRFYLDDIAFKVAATPTAQEGSERAGSPAKPVSANVHRAMWVWNTKPLFDPSRRDEADQFFAFCSRNNIQEIYLAAALDRSDLEGAPRYIIRNPEGYQRFLARAHHAGLSVEALAGTPEWAARENHALALAALDAVFALNRANDVSARFDGIHFDVEPYLLIGYIDPGYRTQILAEFLGMVEKCATRTRREGLHFSCDVPEWFYPGDGLERDRTMVRYNGAEKPVGEHLTDLLETVIIMDYTNRADGRGGIIARGLPALTYAASQKKKVVVGLETFSESDSTVSFVCGLPTEEFRRRLSSTGLWKQLFFEGFRMSVFSDQVNVHIGLSSPQDMAPETPGACEATLARVAHQLGAARDPERFAAAPMLDLARAALAQTPEWKGFEPFEFTDPETHHTIFGFRTTHRMQPDISFHGLGRKTFEEEFDSTVEWLSKVPSFGGTAIHFYDSFRELMEPETERESRSQKAEVMSR